MNSKGIQVKNWGMIWVIYICKVPLLDTSIIIRQPPIPRDCAKVVMAYYEPSVLKRESCSWNYELHSVEVETPVESEGTSTNIRATEDGGFRITLSMQTDTEHLQEKKEVSPK